MMYEEVKKYRELSGDTNPNTPISRIGGYLDGYEKALEQTRWIPVKWHEITDEERKENDYPKEWACYLDSIMPYDGQRILITTKGGYVELDECYSDDGQTFSLDSVYDWIDDVIAWMPLPEPFELQEKEIRDGST